MSNDPNGNKLPEIPTSWQETLKLILAIIAALGGLIGTGISAWNNVKLHGVQGNQEVNSAKLEEVKSHAAGAKEEAAEVKEQVRNVAKEVKKLDK